MLDVYGKGGVWKSALLLIAAGLLTACNDDSGSGKKSVPVEEKSVPAVFNFTTLEASADKDGTFVFTWDKSKHAETYQVCRQEDSLEDLCDPIGKPVTSTTLKLASSEIKAIQGNSYFIRARNEVGYKDSGVLDMALTDLISSISRLEASNISVDAYFGHVTSLSSDGKTLAVSAPHNSATVNSGVYVFNRGDNGVWGAPAFLKHQGSPDSRFGSSISLSGDGKTLAVGAPLHEVIHSQENNPDGSITRWGEFSGRVFVYSRDNKGRWGDPVALNKGEKLGGRDQFGHSVTLNDDGTRLVVGAIWEYVNHVQSGAAYVFDHHLQTGWGEPTKVTAPLTNINEQDEFGYSVSLSADGHILAVGAPSYRGTSASHPGNVYVFEWNTNGNWEAPLRLQSKHPRNADHFGWSLSLSGNSNTLAVAPPYMEGVGRMTHVYHRDASGIWNTQTPTLLHTPVGDYWGDVSLNNDGSVLAVVNGFNGRVNVFSRDDRGVYGAPRYLENKDFGSISLSGDGKTLAVGANTEDSSDNSVKDAGAVYIYQ
ncbi:FG-GAP repeat protein [Photobacterium sagamiensis]|uniref:WD40 repeat domain-containing protein n=1 Tax=Photobacterium sagamiensis TaxID=2910241 RepID=UPI003D13F321